MSSRPLLHVALLDLQGGSEHALVPFLDEMQCRVTLYRIRYPSAMVGALSSTGVYRETQHMIVHCHGDDGAILVRQLSPQFMTPEEPVGPWYPERIREYACIPPCLVVVGGCDTGTPELADAFLDGGAVAVIAPEGAPDYRDILMFHYRFYYELLHRGCTLGEALEKAREHGDAAHFRLFTREGLSLAPAMPLIDES